MRWAFRLSLALLALGLLYELVCAEDVNKLIRNLKDNDSNVRYNAAMTLRKTRNPLSVKPLIIALSDNDKRVRCEAAWALGEIKDPQAIQPLIDALKDDDLYAIECIIGAIGEINDPRTVQPLIDLLLTKGKGVWQIAHVFSKMKDPQTVEPLISALRREVKREYRSERNEISIALWKIGKPTFDRLTTALKDNDLEIIAGTYWIYIRLGDDSAKPFLIEALNKYGTKEMAGEYLGCDNSELENAARNWATTHGYKVFQGYGYSRSSKWGSK